MEDRYNEDDEENHEYLAASDAELLIWRKLVATTPETSEGLSAFAEYVVINYPELEGNESGAFEALVSVAKALCNLAPGPQLDKAAKGEAAYPAPIWKGTALLFDARNLVEAIGLIINENTDELVFVLQSLVRVAMEKIDRGNGGQCY
jgi:hypothetical protein